MGTMPSSKRALPTWDRTCAGKGLLRRLRHLKTSPLSTRTSQNHRLHWFYLNYYNILHYALYCCIYVHYVWTTVHIYNIYYIYIVFLKSTLVTRPVRDRSLHLHLCTSAPHLHLISNGQWPSFDPKRTIFHGQGCCKKNKLLHEPSAKCLRLYRLQMRHHASVDARQNERLPLNVQVLPKSGGVGLSVLVMFWSSRWFVSFPTGKFPFVDYILLFRGFLQQV